MNVEAATMTVPWSQAHEQFRAYQQIVESGKATSDDQTLYQALRQVVRGRKVLDLNLAIANAGYDAAGRPKLAIARADWRMVRMRARSSNGDEAMARWTFENGSTSSHARSVRIEAQVPRGWRTTKHHDSQFNEVKWWEVRGNASVPLVPPQHRPKGNLAGYHILFEAEWLPIPPLDPMLLKHIDGAFYVVLAVWDLTPLEQAVLRARL